MIRTHVQRGARIPEWLHSQVPPGIAEFTRAALFEPPSQDGRAEPTCFPNPERKVYGSDVTAPMQLHPTPAACGSDCIIFENSTAHYTRAGVLNPDPDFRPQVGRRFALLFQDAIHVVDHGLVRLQRFVGMMRDWTYAVVDDGPRSLWWTLVEDVQAGWYDYEGNPIEVEFQPEVVPGMRLVATHVAGFPNLHGYAFTARDTAMDGDMCRGQFDPPLGETGRPVGRADWNVDEYFRIITPVPSGEPSGEGTPGVEEGEGTPDAEEIAALNGRWSSLLEVVAQRANESDGDEDKERWCGEYERAMEEIGVAQGDYARRLPENPPLREFVVEVSLEYRLSPSELDELTGERFGGSDHDVSEGVTWNSEVTVLVSAVDAESAEARVDRVYLSGEGYSGFEDYNVQNCEER